MTAHGPHEAGPVPTQWAASAALFLLLAAPYLWTAARQDGWSRRRTALWLAGCAAAALALSPPASGPEPTAHMARHLLLGMYAPIGLVLGAPVTLLLRALPVAAARRLTRVLRWPPVRWASHPFTGAVLSVGGLYVVMLTPLHAAVARDPLLEGLLLGHYLASGYLFTWSLIGPDPAPHRPGPVVRTAALGAAVAAHVFLARYLYAHALPEGHGAAAAREAAQFMYYGGDVADLLLATALFAAFRTRRRQCVEHGGRGTPLATSLTGKRS